jgi:hypothetical protein
MKYNNKLMEIFGLYFIWGDDARIALTSILLLQDSGGE